MICRQREICACERARPRSADKQLAIIQEQGDCRHAPGILRVRAGELERIDGRLPRFRDGEFEIDAVLIGRGDDCGSCILRDRLVQRGIVDGARCPERRHFEAFGDLRLFGEFAGRAVDAQLFEGEVLILAAEEKLARIQRFLIHFGDILDGEADAAVFQDLRAAAHFRLERDHLVVDPQHEVQALFSVDHLDDRLVFDADVDVLVPFLRKDILFAGGNQIIVVVLQREIDLAVRRKRERHRIQPDAVVVEHAVRADHEQFVVRDVYDEGDLLIVYVLPVVHGVLFPADRDGVRGRIDVCHVGGILDEDVARYAARNDDFDAHFRNVFGHILCPVNEVVGADRADGIGGCIVIVDVLRRLRAFQIDDDGAGNIAEQIVGRGRRREGEYFVDIDVDIRLVDLDLRRSFVEHDKADIEIGVLIVAVLILHGVGKDVIAALLHGGFAARHLGAQTARIGEVHFDLRGDILVAVHRGGHREGNFLADVVAGRGLRCEREFGGDHVAVERFGVAVVQRDALQTHGVIIVVAVFVLRAGNGADGEPAVGVPHLVEQGVEQGAVRRGVAARYIALHARLFGGKGINPHLHDDLGTFRRGGFALVDDLEVQSMVLSVVDPAFVILDDCRRRRAAGISVHRHAGIVVEAPHKVGSPFALFARRFAVLVVLGAAEREIVERFAAARAERIHIDADGDDIVVHLVRLERHARTVDRLVARFGRHADFVFVVLVVNDVVTFRKVVLILREVFAVAQFIHDERETDFVRRITGAVRTGVHDVVFAADQAERNNFRHSIEGLDIFVRRLIDDGHVDVLRYIVIAGRIFGGRGRDDDILRGVLPHDARGEIKAGNRLRIQLDDRLFRIRGGREVEFFLRHISCRIAHGVGNGIIHQVPARLELVFLVGRDLVQELFADAPVLFQLRYGQFDFRADVSVAIVRGRRFRNCDGAAVQAAFGYVLYRNDGSGRIRRRLFAPSAGRKEYGTHAQETKHNNQFLSHKFLLFYSFQLSANVFTVILSAERFFP